MAKDKSHLLSEEGLQPMDPSSQCLNSHHLSLCILGIVESEIPIDVEKITTCVKTDLIPLNPVYSSVVVRKNGKQWWKRVEVHLDDHIIVPAFPPGLSPELYTQHLDEYLSKIGVEKLPESRPLWEIHIVKYPTQTAAGTLLFKMSHALGDGFSIMGLVLSIFKRADNSSLPLTFPSAKPPRSDLERKRTNVWKRNLRLIYGALWIVCRRCLGLIYGALFGFWKRGFGLIYGTLFDMATSFRAALFGDSRSAIRSATESVERSPKQSTRVTFSMEDILQLKTKYGVTVNDIMVGLIFYGIHLYTNVTDWNANQTRKTGIVLLNTRMLDGYRNLEEMLKEKLWGNHFSFLYVPMPYGFKEGKVDLKTFILEASKIIKRSKNSMAVYLNGILLAFVGRLAGIEATSKCIHYVMKNTSFGISNLVGPLEKLAMADHPINNLCFTVTGIPQSLSFFVMSYMGKLTIVITAEKEFIDSQLLASCMNEALKKVLEKI